VVDRAELPWSLTPAVAPRKSDDRNSGVGSNRILIAGDTGRGGSSSWARILNPDSSEAEKSGNGLRIFGAYLHGRSLVTGGGSRSRS
jgi:diaminopimelate epimerase